jgi:hypothetical protein
MTTLQFGIFKDSELDSKPIPPIGRALGAGLLACWMLAMLAGRLIAYSGVFLAG